MLTEVLEREVEVVVTRFLDQNRRGRRITERIDSRPTRRRPLGTEIPAFVAVGEDVFAVDDHRAAADAAPQIAVGDLQCAKPTRACIQDIEAGRVCHPKRSLEQVCRRRFEPATNHTCIDQEVYVLGTNRCRIEGQCRGLDSEIECLLAFIQSIPDLRPRALEHLPNPLLGGFELQRRHARSVVFPDAFEDPVVGDTPGRHGVLNGRDPHPIPIRASQVRGRRLTGSGFLGAPTASLPGAPHRSRRGRSLASPEPRTRRWRQTRGDTRVRIREGRGS